MNYHSSASTLIGEPKKCVRSVFCSSAGYQQLNKVPRKKKPFSVKAGVSYMHIPKQTHTQVFCTPYIYTECISM